VTRFEVTDRSNETIAVPPEPIWEVLTDPDLLARMTPLIDGIDVVGGDHWRWHLVTIGGLGHSVTPSFTVRMDFTDLERIDFAHDPPPSAKERAGADGVYTLEPVGPDSTHLAVDMTVHVDLPLPAVSRGAVTRVMKGTMARMGDRFAHNLCRHLGVTR
jgi:carbon monoxide dehydrogenase subunit G